MKCPYCGLENPDTALKCNCGYVFREYRENVERVSSTATRISEPTESSRFKTLVTLGKTLSILGWVWVVIAIIVGFVIADKDQIIIPILSGVVAAIPGFFIFAQGQLILCFVSIERGIQDIKKEVVNLSKETK